MSTNSPYVNFPGNGAEVLAQWQELFGGELDVMSYDDFPDPEAAFGFAPPQGALAHGTLTGGLLNVAGGDAIMSETPPALPSETYSFLISPDTAKEASALAERIAAAGGEVVMPIEQAPWGAFYGQVKDRNGVLFQLNVEAAAPQA